MNLYKLFRKTTMILAAVAVPLTLLITTNIGLNAVFTIVTMFTPVQFSYGQVSGKIIGAPIKISNVTLIHTGRTLKIENVTFDWQLKALTANNIRGLEQFLPYASKVAYQEFLINKAYAQINFKENSLVFNVQLFGQAAQAPLHGNVRLTNHNSMWDINHAVLMIGDNVINLQRHNVKQYKWNITIKQPNVMFKNSTGTIIAHGHIQDLNTTPSIQAHVQTKHFAMSNYAVNNLQARVNLVIQPSAPLFANITASNVRFDATHLEDIKLSLHGDLAQHTLNFNAMYENEPVALHIKGRLNEKMWHAHDLMLGYKKEQLVGTSTYNLKDRSSTTSLRGSIATFPTTAVLKFTNLQNASLQLHMRNNAQNYLNGLINVNDKRLDGNVKVVANDLAFLMEWMPDVTRLKGNLSGNINVAGTLNAPTITAEASVTNITATMPGLGIKIKPMELHLRGDKFGKFTIQGKGKMRRGTGDFTLNGFVEPFKPDMPNSLTIEGKNVEFINNQLAHLTASNKLHVHYAKHERRLDLTGDIEIHKGNVTIADKRAQTVKSKDVVFVNEAPPEPKYVVAVNPDINLRIAEGVHFDGFGLDADVTGKLNISHRHDALYADGRVTIKQGTFQLPGQKLLINHGRLLYPPGTLLANPVLDIKMLGKNPMSTSATDNKQDLELNVQGTAHKPVISETGLAGNNDRALSQALLTGTGVISNNLLQDKLKISEIGLESREAESVGFFDDPSKDKSSLKNKDLVVGRSLGRKFYLQYLHSMGEANKRVRLKYSLNPIWAIGIESGTQGGGADLSFTIERD